MEVENACQWPFAKLRASPLHVQPDNLLDEKSLTAYFNGLVVPSLDYDDIEISLV